MVAPGALLLALNVSSWFTANDSQGCALFRREFEIDAPPKKAIVGFTAAGYAEIWINGVKGDSSAVLEPGWTQWDRRLLVPTYDVTDQLHRGKNAVGFALAAGWFGHLGNLPSAKLTLAMTFGENDDAEILNISTDANWTTGPCPVKQSDIYLGEVYDAALEQTNWSLPGGAPHWTGVKPQIPPDVLSAATLSFQEMAPIRMLNLLSPSFVTMTREQGIILDFGKNIAGWVRLELSSCSRGSKVTVRHAEFLVENRTELYTGNLRGAKATDVYICAGGPVQHEPHFTYHGFRFAEISVSGNAEWSWADQRARIVHSAVEPRGVAYFDNDVLMQVQDAIRRTQLDNLYSVPTDCPQRDERQGWMADASVSAEQAVFNFDMKSFYLNWLRTIEDSQQSTYAHDCSISVPGGGVNGTCLGAVTDTSPHPKGVYGTRPADPSWGAALPILADLIHRYYDEDTVQPFVPAVHAWAKFLLTMRQNGVVKYHNYGDWLEPGKVASNPIVSEMTAAFNSLLAVHVASTLGDAPSRSHFAEEYDSMREAFESTYWNETISAFADGTQAPQVFALHHGGLTPQRERAALNRLLHLLDRDGIATGIIATKWLFPLLSKYGHTALGLMLASGTAFPSWGYMIAKGATTIWEHWDTYHNPSGDGMSSHNHPAFTSVGAWFYTDLIGIRIDRIPFELGPSLNSFNPLLPSASGNVTTPHGVVAVNWRMRPTVVVEGESPIRSIVRIPLDGMPVAVALRGLRSVGRVDSATACGPALCATLSGGEFRFELMRESEVVI